MREQVGNGFEETILGIVFHVDAEVFYCALSVQLYPVLI